MSVHMILLRFFYQDTQSKLPMQSHLLTSYVFFAVSVHLHWFRINVDTVHSDLVRKEFPRERWQKMQRATLHNAAGMKQNNTIQS